MIQVNSPGQIPGDENGTQGPLSMQAGPVPTGGKVQGYTGNLI